MLRLSRRLSRPSAARHTSSLELAGGCLSRSALPRSSSAFPQSSSALLRSSSALSARSFSTLAPLLEAVILSGKDLARKFRLAAAEQVAEIQKVNPRFQPRLAIVQVGARPDSSTYVRMKLKAAAASRVQCDLVQLPAAVSQEELLYRIEQLNSDLAVHGILVQLPLPQHLDATAVTNAVAPAKDVDGFTRHNAGELAKRGGAPSFVPCTPAGIVELLKAAGVAVAGKHAVVLGRSDIVGTPVAALLQRLDATVTLCHSGTRDIPALVAQADIVVAAVGSPGFVQGAWLKRGAVVVDVGINYVADPAARSGRRLVGDVDFASASAVASVLTPVPGGVGPMTVAMLVASVLRAAKAQELRKFQPVDPAAGVLALAPRAPVPSDIAISRAQHPRPIAAVARGLGVRSAEFEPYGHAKGKVSLDVLRRLAGERDDAHYVLVAGITPTPLGEGKSTTTVGLVQALGAHLRRPAVATVRQPSMGPTFGVKGGAAGGGYAQVIPMDEFNMHLTGDIHAIGAANNLLAAAVDTRIFHEATQKSSAALYRRLVPRRGGTRRFTPSMLRRLTALGIAKTDPDALTAEEAERFARLNIDKDRVYIKRVVDVNDRFLREVTVGQAATEKGFNRATGFDITVASELMAILALASDLRDLRARVGRVVVAASTVGTPVTAEDIGAAGAVTALLKDALKPTLMQTLEGQPVLVHAGPFANISIGASSVVADKIALKLLGTPKHPAVVRRELALLAGDWDAAGGSGGGGSAAADPPHSDALQRYLPSKGYVVTEAGFDFTMGGERFFNIKCRSGGLRPDVVVIVATTRALKLHGGGPDVTPGMALPREYQSESLGLVDAGCANLRKQVANARSFGSPVVVAINQFSSDSPREIALIKEHALAAGAAAAVESNHWAEGGRGAIRLAEAVVRIAEGNDSVPKPPVNFLYDPANPSIEAKLTAIATQMYGADGIELSDLARAQIASFEEHSLNTLPVCIAKTQYSLSHDPALKGVPSGFKIPIREIKASVGAGYLYALAGKIMTIPGLPTHSGFMNVEVNEETGDIEGLF